MNEPTVTITVARLTELEALAAIGQKTKEKNDADFKRLAERNKTDPTHYNETVRQWKARNREAYNARQRELYRLKKEAAAAAMAQTAGLPGNSAVCLTTKTPGTK
jgi:hypothetical protein